MNTATNPSPEGRELLVALLHQVQLAHANCQEERGKLHEVEWSSGECHPSVLGEAEVLADAVVGVVQAILTHGLSPARRKVLAERGVHRSLALHEWLKQSDSEYPAFAVYVQAIEFLRAVALHQIASNPQIS